MKKLFQSSILLVGVMLAGSCVNKSGQTVKVPNYALTAHERLGRGVIVMPLESGKTVYNHDETYDRTKRKVYIGWRLLASDPDKIGFNVYRRDEKGENVKINAQPVVKSTNIIDAELPDGDRFSYTVTTVIDGKESEPSQPYDFIFDTEVKPYKSIKFKGNYTADRIGVGDLDGDGEMDYVVKYPNESIDPYYTDWVPSPDTYKLDAYTSKGELLWTYDMGWAIELGNWYSPYIVYDLDGDGKAEVILKSGVNDPDPRNEKGMVITGPEYVTVLDGMTGKPIASADWYPRDEFIARDGKDGYNYASRNQLAVAYLDGVHPHIIVLRGTYSIMAARAYRYESKELKQVWEWDNLKLRNDDDPTKNYYCQGAHTTLVADVDDDGFDEVILGSCALDHDGKPLWSTGLGHADGAFIGDIIPERPGLEIFLNIEGYYGREDVRINENGMCMVDARTGEIIWGAKFPTMHVHDAGFCSDIDRTSPGRECYGIEVADDEGKRPEVPVLFSNTGEILDRRSLLSDWSVYWDTDNQRELLGTYGDYKVRKIWDYAGGHVFDVTVEGQLLTVADIFGDWREEIITSMPGELRIYSTTIPAGIRYNCLMQDPQYRSCVSQTATGYNALPMTTYDLPFISTR
ncbi:MAG: hypothetical protein LBR84_04620 [Tannerella sp.]|jgi:hypothetical protein|nr:hypothetical protein [Tannerella sp.]